MWLCTTTNSVCPLTHMCLLLSNIGWALQNKLLTKAFHLWNYIPFLHSSNKTTFSFIGQQQFFTLFTHHWHHMPQLLIDPKHWKLTLFFWSYLPVVADQMSASVKNLTFPLSVSLQMTTCLATGTPPHNPSVTNSPATTSISTPHSTAFFWICWNKQNVQGVKEVKLIFMG